MIQTTVKTTPTDSNVETLETSGADGGEADMLKIAQEADRALDLPEGDGKPVTTEAKGNAQPDQTEGGKPKEGQDGKPAAKGKDGKPPADGSAKPDGKDTQGQPKTEADKAKAEGERRDRSWQALEKEKAEFRAEKNTLASELQALRREVSDLRRKPQQPTGPVKDANGATAEDYDKMAEEYKKAGDDSMAKAAAERAANLRKQAPTTEAPRQGDAFGTPEFQEKWEANVQDLIRNHGELADPANPLVIATNKLLVDPTYGRFFKSAPDGIKAAFDVACLMRDAAAAKETSEKLTAAQEELKTTKAEVARLNGLLQPRGSHPAGPTTGKPTGDMSDADVRAIAAAADRGELDQT